MNEIPKRDRPLSAIYYETAKEWADLDAAARILEETKSAVLAQKKAMFGDIPDSKAETKVKASQEWHDFIAQMVVQRTLANKARIKMDYLKMRHAEQQSKEATARHEARLDR